MLAHHNPGDLRIRGDLTGTYFEKNVYGDGEPTGELDLRWLMKDMRGETKSTVLAGFGVGAGNVQFGEMCTIDASFSYDGADTCTARVSVNGQPAASIYGRMHPLSAIHLYNVDSGLARYGDIDVWYE